MSDLRKAAEMALEVMEYNRANGTPNMGAAIQALRQALAQHVDAVNISAERVDETAKGEHEPFIYVREDNERPFGGYEHCSEADAGAFPVYTAPPKREWIGLTDEEVSSVYKSHVLLAFYKPYRIEEYEWVFWLTNFARDIEEAIKEKNT